MTAHIIKGVGSGLMAGLIALWLTATIFGLGTDECEATKISSPLTPAP